MLMPEKMLCVRELARPQAERDRADQPRVVGPAEGGHAEGEQRPRHVVACMTK